VIYAAFTFWLLLIIFAGVGVYRLWAGLGKGVWLNWALLPGTIVSEMGYIFGCLITGGEVRRARIVPDPAAAGKAGNDGEPTTEASARLKYAGPILAALISIIACAAAILVVHSLLGGPVMGRFSTAGGLLAHASLPTALPTSWDMLWDQITGQVVLLKRMCETWAGADWLDWRVGLFIYVSLCLAIKLSPTGRALRPTLAAAVAASVIVALVGLVWPRFSGLIQDIWPLLTYVWASLLTVLVVTLIIRGLVALVCVLAGKEGR